MFGNCNDVGISRKNFSEGTALAYDDYQFIWRGPFFLLMQTGNNLFAMPNLQASSTVWWNCFCIWFFKFIWCLKLAYLL